MEVCAAPILNPSLDALHEAFLAFPDREIGCFLSLGTGMPMTIRIEGWILPVVGSLIALVTNCEKTHIDTRNDILRNAGSDGQNCYFRFSANNLKGVHFDDHTLIEEVVAQTKKYMKNDDVMRHITACVLTLEQLLVHS